MIFKILSLLTAVIGICLVFELTPDGITDGLLELLKPKETLAAKSAALRGRHKKGAYLRLLKLKEALKATGKTKSFSAAVTASAVLTALGVAAAVLIKNMFLIPVFCAAFASIPFMYVGGIISAYEKQLDDEMETTLSAVTNSYLRSEDIIGAVRENLNYIKPPLYSVFKGFLTETESVSADVKKALYNMADKTGDGIFKEWIEALVRCQDDRTLKDALQPIVSKLSDVRTVNTELAGILKDAKNEYLMMVFLVVGNIPLLYFLNRDWFNTLVFTTPGKAVTGICGGVILITFILMKKYTKPIKYGR